MFSSNVHVRNSTLAQQLHDLTLGTHNGDAAATRQARLSQSGKQLATNMYEATMITVSSIVDQDATEAPRLPVHVTASGENALADMGGPDAVEAYRLFMHNRR
jgi:hypothetical protein